MKISVAMTCYNGSKYLTEQLDSLRLQSRKIDEVRIIDDNSTDDSQILIKEYIKNHNLSDWVITSNPENLGWKKNFHKAILQTSGDIVFFCDQDDIWHDNKIELMVNTLIKKPDIKVLACRLNLIDSYGNSLPKMHDRFPFDSKNTSKVIKNTVDSKFMYTISPGCTLAVKRELITKLYKEEVSKDLAHDGLFWKIGTCMDCAFVLDEALIDYRIHANNASNPSAALKWSTKTTEKRISEVNSYIEMLTIVRTITTSLNVKSDYLELIDREIDHLENRRRWLSNKKIFPIFGFALKNYRFYRNYKMILGDIFAKLKKT